MFSFPAVTSAVAANASLPIADYLFPLSIDPAVGVPLLFLGAIGLAAAIINRLARDPHRVAHPAVGSC
jgi:hypothetical protein